LISRLQTRFALLMLDGDDNNTTTGAHAMKTYTTINENWVLSVLLGKAPASVYATEATGYQVTTWQEDDNGMHRPTATETAPTYAHAQAIKRRSDKQRANDDRMRTTRPAPRNRPTLDDMLKKFEGFPECQNAALHLF